MSKKKHFTIFFSWMSDRPKGQNRKYISDRLSEDIEKLEKALSVEITIESDSRGEDGSDSIDVAILKKIARSDFFVGDVTSLVNEEENGGKSYIPNPNVMFELGFAVSTLGWNRCIMVSNESYGIIRNAPFDIRNHSIKGYLVGDRDLSLFTILREKIERYDELVKEWRLAEERSFDAEKYLAICELFPERELLDSISHFLTNRVYSRLTFTKWVDLTSTYRAYPDTHFVDEELHRHYSAFLEALGRLEGFAAANNKPLYTNKYLNPNSKDWDSNYMYVIKKPFDYIADEDKALGEERKIEAEIEEIGDLVMSTYKEFRDLVRMKLLI